MLYEVLLLQTTEHVEFTDIASLRTFIYKSYDRTEIKCLRTINDQP